VSGQLHGQHCRGPARAVIRVCRFQASLVG
jgi:hypothetical protein